MRSVLFFLLVAAVFIAAAAGISQSISEQRMADEAIQGMIETGKRWQETDAKTIFE